MALMKVFLFSALPYAAIMMFVVGTIYRYRATGFQVSALSSQFLEGRALFWGSVPFHFGILACLAGHLLALFIPAGVLAWNAEPARLLLLEITGMAFGFSVLVGIVALLVRRAVNQRVRMVTNRMDVVIELLLVAQALLGVAIAYHHRWGSSWFAADLAPYLWSLAAFNPEIEAVAAMPWMVQTHVIGAFVIVALFPFTRLVHLLVAPLHYIWRPTQQVIWNWDRTAIRHPDTPWSPARPRNN